MFSAVLFCIGVAMWVRGEILYGEMTRAKRPGSDKQSWKYWELREQSRTWLRFGLSFVGAAGILHVFNF